jgi:Protein of unknown function (DUF1214)
MNAPLAASSIALREAWADYHATLEEVRIAMESTPRFQATPQHRAKAYHTLMEMQAMAYNFAIAPRMLHPRIFVNCGWQTEMYTLGQNGQDFLYGVVFIDGTQTYRLKGRMGDISLFLLQILNGLFGEKGVKAYGNYDWADFKIENDGTFEVILSAEKHEGNWIKVDPTIGYQFILIRRALPKWDGDRGELSLERISKLPDNHYDADEFDEAAMATRIRRAALFVRYLTNDFNINLYDWYSKNSNAKKNNLTLLPGIVTSEVGSPTSNYAMAVFELEDDEALLIEMDKKPDGAYWSFQLGDVWSRSLDFTSRQSSLNDHEALPDGDNKLRIVVANRDPGLANWLDPCGRVEGTVVFRNYRAKTPDVPNSRLVKLTELDAILPKDTRRVTPEQRKQMMTKRRIAMRKLYGE